MRIVHLACVAPPTIGGIGRVASLEVASLQKRGISATLHSPATVPSLWSYGNSAVPHPWALERAVRGADIVHLHYPYYGMSEIITIFKWLRRIQKLVVTVHMDATHAGLRGVILNVHRAMFQTFELNTADALLVSSRDYVMHSSYAQWLNKMIELPFGVDTEQFSPGMADRSEYGIPADVPVLVFVGGMDAAHAFKGIDVLLRAFAELPRNTRLVLGGDGSLRTKYERLSHECGVAERCLFLGKVMPERLADVYRLGDVFVFPSTSAAEAFGLVALEAQACGIPVVASDLPGVRTVIADKVTGLLTPAGDARELAAHLRLLLENPDMRRTFGAAGRARVLERFTWTKHMDDLVEVYTRICASP